MGRVLKGEINSENTNDAKRTVVRIVVVGWDFTVRSGSSRKDREKE